MARASMADLIARLRTLIGDPEGDTQQFTGNDIQAALDQRRTDVVEAALRYRPSFTDPGVYAYVDFFAPVPDWEDSVVLHDVTGEVITPDTSDLIAGHWTFTTGQAIPVYITGSFFDMYGTAGIMLENWAAAVAREFDFSINAGPSQQSFNRSQKRTGLLETARAYARRARQPSVRPRSRSTDW